MATNRDFVVKNGLVVTEDIELGHATDTTIARASSGVISVEGNNVIMASNNVGALTDSTSAAIGIGTIELGHASDTTIARASAGQITVEGTAVVLAGSASHDGFSDFVANEHIDHSGVSITAGDGLTGGGTIASSRTLAVGAGTGVTVNANDVAIGQAVGTSDDVTFATVTLASDLIHSGDTNNKIAFGTDTQSFETGGTARFNISDSGLQIGTGARVTTIENNDSLGTSDTKLCTQGNVKAYVDANAGGASALGDLSDAVTTATDNIGIGPSALDSISASNGNYNIGIGRDTGTSITTGDRNVCIGWNAGEDIVDVSDNVFVGALSGFNATGGSNTVVGTNAFRTATAGIDNVSIGKSSMYSSAAGNYNVAVGSSAMYASTAGNDNIGIGHDAGDNITSGSNNVVIGGFDVDTATGDDQIIVGSGDGGVTWLKGDSNGIKALKIKVKAVTGTETLTDAQSGSYVYVTGSGVPTLPATAESGQQYTIINNTGGNLTPGLGTSNAIATGWTAHAAMSDETARTYICVAANKWIYIG
jgi:hypothetical protein